MAYLDELARLVKKCKTMSRKACTAARGKGGKRGRDEVGIDMWKERGTRVCLILASQLIEMKVRFLLCVSRSLLIMMHTLTFA